MNPIGLELKPSKTKYSNTLYEYKENIGFDFLGFTIRQFEVGNYRSAKNPQGKRLGFVTQIQPSKQKQKVHLEKIAKVINSFKSNKQSDLILKLNPIIRGWTNYYSTIFASKTFSRMDYLVWQKLRAWALYSCDSTNKHKVMKKYWHKKDNENWRFSTKNGLVLAKYIDTKTKIHIKVQGRRSPYDGDYIYWSSRMGHHPELPSELSRLLHEQKGKCEWCKLHFFYGDLL